MILESKPAATDALQAFVTALGLLFMYLARGFRTGGTNVRAAFALGCLFFGLGVVALVIGESRTVAVDEAGRVIRLTVRHRVGGTRVIEIPFGEVRAVEIGMLGRAGTRHYDLVVQRVRGRDVYLFGGCAFEGRMSRDWVDGLRSEIEQMVFRASRGPTDHRRSPAPSLTAK